MSIMGGSERTTVLGWYRSGIGAVRPLPWGEPTYILLDKHILVWAYAEVMSTTFAVLAEPHRRQILDLLRVEDRSVGELVDQLPLTQPSVSKHLRVLRDAGLVSVHPDAQRRVYRLRPEPLHELDAWLTPYRRAWAQRLDDLEAHLDTMEDR
jgi:DNA-binding transcriptional ArsR family regulator